MENVTAILSAALTNLSQTELVAITAGTARQIGLSVQPNWPDDRPIEFAVSAIRSKLQSPPQEPDDDAADL
jgi:hypothetical protein